MAQIDAWIKDARSIGIAGHVHPDGDCVGSTVSLYNYIYDQLKRSGKEVRRGFPEANEKADDAVYLDLYLEDFDASYRFVKRSDEANAILIKEDVVYDVFFALDCGDENRIGVAKEAFQRARKKICIDHHITNPGYGDINCIDANSSSTSELIHGFMEANFVDHAIAEGLFLGIVQDTGVFSYSCTHESTMQLAGQLMTKGINFSRIIEDSFFAKTYAQQRILGAVLTSSTLLNEGQCIFGSVTQEMMAAYQVTPSDLEGIVSQLRNTTGVEVAVFLYETKKGEFKVSLRSRQVVDVSAIAGHFGGGGHVRAAGCTVEGSLDEVRAAVLKEVDEALGKNVIGVNEADNALKEGALGK